MMIFYMNICWLHYGIFDWKSTGSFVLHMNVNAWIAAFVLFPWRSIYRSGIFFSIGVQYVGAQDAAIFKYI